MLMDPRNRDFLAERPRLLALAYRMLGSMADSEDILQEAWLRWSRTRAQTIENVPAFLTSVVSRLCIDRLRRRRIETLNYPGPWLPEPVPDDEDPSHADVAAIEAISVAFLLMLENLTPHERGVFILKEAFEYSHDEIAALLGIRVANCRQLLRRARRALAGRALPANPADPEPLVNAFFVAAEQGDLDALQQLIASDAVAYSDGGGKVTAARIPLHGRARIATVFAHLVRNQMANISAQWQLINGDKALVLFDGEQVHSVSHFIIEAGQIVHLQVMRNPAKMQRVRRL